MTLLTLVGIVIALIALKVGIAQLAVAETPTPAMAAPMQTRDFAEPFCGSGEPWTRNAIYIIDAGKGGVATVPGLKAPPAPPTF